jgi:chromosome transmission fidelity protein 1
LCINPRINQLEFRDIEDGCLDFVNPWRSEIRCNYFAKYIEEGKFSSKGCQSLEDLIQLGKKKGVCPYYIQKDLIKDAQVRIVSQNLDPSPFDFEESKGIKEILLVDECYELDERIAKSFTEPISKRFLEECIQSTDYLNKSLKNLKGENEKIDIKSEKN